MEFVLIILIISCVFSLGIILLWIATNSEKFFKYAFSKPVITRRELFSKDADLSNWIFMYYVTKLSIFSFVGLILIYIFNALR